MAIWLRLTLGFNNQYNCHQDDCDDFAINDSDLFFLLYKQFDIYISLFLYPFLDVYYTGAAGECRVLRNPSSGETSSREEEFRLSVVC